VADALQGTGQGVESQPGIGGNEVKIEVDGFHKGLPVCGVSLNALFLA
jgi:hypothetical protein